MLSLLLQGRPAFSNFRLQALRHTLNDVIQNKDISYLDAVEIYCIEIVEPLDDNTTKRIYSLLNATQEFDRSHGFFVMPRRGTISPWSSKATDIFHNCGLKKVLRVERGIHFKISTLNSLELGIEALGSATIALHDRMTEEVYTSLSDFFGHCDPARMRTVPIIKKGSKALIKANLDWGLAMSSEEVEYLVEAYNKIERDPTDTELVMFSQVNSEHCRHKIFNADWIIDGSPSEQSLFKMIRNTHEINPDGVLVAYSDNSGVLEGSLGDWWEVAVEDGSYRYRKTPTRLDILCKVETHNHPTAISPFSGAATGVGGEIRDEGATGIGGRPKAGLSAFMVSDLKVPGYKQPWEQTRAEHPSRMASPLAIMLEGPIGGAAFGNEFGRPQICGMFRTLDIVHNGIYRGYHKPIMAAGGMGNLKREHVAKKDIPPKALIIQLGGPAMKIGLGGGAASSIGAGSQSETLDFDSVQRGNPEMERRCQQVIDGCIALGAANPMLSIHDIGAGGLSNGLPELIEATGGRFYLRKINNEDSSMSPMEIWCNESQERYVMAVLPECIKVFESLCSRERCPFAIVGEATDDGRLVLEDSHYDNKPIDMEIGVLLGKTPKMVRDVVRLTEAHAALETANIQLDIAVDRVLRFPAVANKTFLITIADRSITGMVTRDQMVGPWQTPVADVAVTSSSMDAYTGEAMAIGERTPLAIVNAPASGRIAIGECLTNIAAANVGEIGNIKLSANWMVAAGEAGEDAMLYDTVQAVGMELCPALGICIPVGKDSMSMQTSWQDSAGAQHKQVSPLSLMITGFSSVADVRKTLTPDLKSHDSSLLLIDLGSGKNRLGGSSLAQVYNQIGAKTPDLDSPEQFLGFFSAIQEMLSEDLILSYHDRGDGGLITTLAEMAFAGRKGIRMILDHALASSQSPSPLNILFAEELGAVIEVDKNMLSAVMTVLSKYKVADITQLIGNTTANDTLSVILNNQTIYSESLTTLNRAWSELTYHMQAQRDNPECAQEEYDALLKPNSGTLIEPSYDPDAVFYITSGQRPKMAIFREQGINGQNEMGFAFDRVGFDAIDVHMTDLLTERTNLEDYAGLVACGGFSYGDVLGAGSGWAKSILYNDKLKDMFQAFFERNSSFSLGVCNGCQMISQLKELIPGAAYWPEFKRNRSEQFEARYANVEVLNSPSLFFQGMQGSLLPIPIAHGEGRADFSTTGDLDQCMEQKLVSARYIDPDGAPADSYPHNPNGSPEGATAYSSSDGRATIMMPHPERLFRAVQMSYRPKDQFTGEAGPWMKMFQNAAEYAASV